MRTALSAFILSLLFHEGLHARYEPTGTRPDAVLQSFSAQVVSVSVSPEGQDVIFFTWRRVWTQTYGEAGKWITVGEYKILRIRDEPFEQYAPAPEGRRQTCLVMATSKLAERSNANSEGPGVLDVTDAAYKEGNIYYFIDKTKVMIQRGR